MQEEKEMRKLGGSREKGELAKRGQGRVGCLLDILQPLGHGLLMDQRKIPTKALIVILKYSEQVVASVNN